MTTLIIHKDWIKKETEKAYFIKVGMSGYFFWIAKQFTKVVNNTIQITLNDYFQLDLKKFHHGKVTKEVTTVLLGVSSYFRDDELKSKEEIKNEYEL